MCYNNTAESASIMHNYEHVPYMYKFLRDVIFADYPNLGFPRFYFHGSLVITPCTSSILQLFYKISRI